MKLTDLTARTALPREKPYKLSDGWGMYLYVLPNGSKYWRMKYRFMGREKTLALGVYPEVSLKTARELRDIARLQLSNDIDPNEAKRQSQMQLAACAEKSFERVAREWHCNKSACWSGAYAETILHRLDRDVFPHIGHKPIALVTAPELLNISRQIERRQALDLSNRVLQYCRQIFAYAIATCRADRNPAADLKGALRMPIRKHFSHFKEAELPEFLRRLEEDSGTDITKLALKLLVLTLGRTVEIRGARWSEFNLDKKIWHIPAERMKMRKPHIVPLSNQCERILEKLKPISGQRDLLFPNRNDPKDCISENTLLYALYRMGYHDHATIHGFRHTGSTILNEHGFRSDIIEVSLAHTDKDRIRGTYNHATYLEERRAMMQWWADYLDRCADGRGNIIEWKTKEHQS